MQTEILFSCLLVVILLTAWRIYYARRKSSALPYPPGPKPAPLIGNLRDLPKEDQAATYTEWAKKYGDVVHVSVFGNHLVFLNTLDACNDLFEKRGQNYADRNPLHMINDLMGWDWSFGMMPYGERWRAHRKMFHQQFMGPAIPNYWPIQVKQSHALLRRLLHTPEEFVDHLRWNSASTIMKVIYGIQIAPKNDRYIDVAEDALAAMAKAAEPGAFFVDLFPILKKVPEWLPGAGFKRKAFAWKKTVIEMRDAPFEDTKRQLSLGIADPSFVSTLLDNLDSQMDPTTQHEIIRNCSGLAYAAGAESTVASMKCFFLAMVLHPDVQAKAHAELDRVLNRERLPEFQDRENLPYINVIIKEILRWNPVAPLGLPHMATNEDTYRGFRIPAGATIIGNTWAILHDPSVYHQPLKFNPDRWLVADPPPDPVMAFGHGRRICPGRLMADAQLWISVTSILSVFAIGVARDEYGNPIPPTTRFASGMISHPAPFACFIKPRFEKASQLVEQSADL